MLTKTKDNSGVKLVKTINFQLQKGLFFESLGSIQLSQHEKIRPGQLHQISINGRRQWFKRQTGINSRLSYNLSCLIKKDHTPLASRLYGCVYLESRVTGHMRLAVLSKCLL